MNSSMLPRLAAHCNAQEGFDMDDGTWERAWQVYLENRELRAERDKVTGLLVKEAIRGIKRVLADAP